MTICAGCGKKIVWIETADGKKIPLDPRPPVYSYTPIVGSSGRFVGARLEGAAVSHFATCPKANDFSASKKS